MARRRTTSPQLSLVIVAVAIIAAYVPIILGGLTPKLGLDLSGGTSLTLRPKVINSTKPPTQAALDKAVDIIRLRVNGSGIGEAEVRKQGPYIVVEVPGSDREGVINRVGKTAQLFFREVAESSVDESILPPQPTPSASASASAPAAAAGSASPAAAVASPSVVVEPASPAASVTARPRPLPAAPTPTPAAASSASSATGASPAAAPSARPATDGGRPATDGGRPASCAEAEAAKDAGKACAEATYATLRCGDPRQVNTGAQDPGEHWTVGCGRGKADPYKYLLKPAVVRGTDVKSASADIVTTGSGQTQIATNDWRVVLSFKNSNFEKLTTTTAYGSTAGSCPAATQPTTCQTAVVLDGVVESAPTNSTAIAGDAEITGNFNQTEAEALANVLKYGALPLAFDDNAQAETISPTLGRDSLHAGLLAGGIGLAIVVLYCFIYYRALGIVTIASLAVSGLMVYATIVLLGKSAGLTLSLAGIAGFIVAIGITADSFVVFYERLKDEVRDGRSVRSAVEVGWRSARRTILSADTISLLAAVLLYLVSIGSVRGFAFTLGVSTLLDVVTVFLFTKPLVTLLVRRRFFSAGRWSGLAASTPNAPLRRRPGPGGRLAAPGEVTP